MGGVKFSNVVALLGLFIVLIGYSLVDILACFRHGRRRDALTQAEHVVRAGIFVGHCPSPGDLCEIVDIAGARGIRGRNGELARNLRAPLAQRKEHSAHWQQKEGHFPAAEPESCTRLWCCTTEPSHTPKSRMQCACAPIYLRTSSQKLDRQTAYALRWRPCTICAIYSI